MLELNQIYYIPLEFIKPYAALTEKHLSGLNLPEKPESLYAPQRYILSNGGKRIRPVLTLMSCGLCGEPEETAIPAAIAVELLHNFTLIHDDIMDQAESRRGNPSVHIRWDEPSAILAGDGMFVQAMLSLQSLPDQISHKRISDIFLKGINTVCEGQALDMEFEQRNDVTISEYLRMIEGKTAALISASMQMGGLCAGADDEQLEHLGVIGHSLGLAFQIQDDWLDVTADPETFGKRKGGDIYEGKKTFLMLSALERCNDSQRKRIRTYLSNLPMSDEQVEETIGIFQECGADREAKELSDRYYQKAIESLNRFEDSRYKQDLKQLINYLKNREK